MSCKLISKRGNSLLVQKGEMFFFIDMLTDTYQKNADPNVFYKMEYFVEVTPEDESHLEEIEKILEGENGEPEGGD